MNPLYKMSFFGKNKFLKSYKFLLKVAIDYV